ncbi:MAG TPA: glycosyltransferase family 1 protein [Bacteroidia bacterium]|nr:glycosyltransferase family 1 protein [Bacteroidia bacterium]
MKIAVNTRLFLKDKMEGMGWFGYESLKRIVQNHPEHRFIFIFDRPYSPEFVFANNVTPVVLFPPTRHPFLWFVWLECMLPFVLRKHKADLFLSPDGMISLLSNTKSLAVIHDLNFIYYKKDMPFWVEKYYNFFFPRFAKKSVRLATVSEYSKKDIVLNYGIDADKIDVVYNGANLLYRPISEPEKTATKKEWSEGNDYFLFVGAMHPRKNIVNLFKAFDAFKAKSKSVVKLVIVGNKMYWRADIEACFEAMQFKKDVVFTGRLSPEKLKNVLGAAMALTYVPYFEGFGIPIVEAFYCDVPVITSTITSMPEIAGDAALLVDPFSVTEIAEAMGKIEGDADLRFALIEKGKIRRQEFTWDKTADKLWNCIEKALAT